MLGVENRTSAHAQVKHFARTWPNDYKPRLSYNWRFSRYSAPIHWLVHGHVTSNNETVYRQMPWVGDIAKTMTSNEKQFTVTREMLTTVAIDLSLYYPWSERAVERGLVLSSAPFLLYNKSLNNCSFGEQWILFPSNLNVLEFSRNKIHCSPRDQSLSANYATSINVAWKIWHFKRSQQHPTCSNTSQHGGQTHATFGAQQCCNMSRREVAIVWPRLNTVKHSCFIFRNCWWFSFWSAWFPLYNQRSE